MSASAHCQTIMATPVPGKSRLATLPRYFPQYFSAYESTVYQFSDRLIPGYNGGYWEFIELDNGGFFMSLDVKQPFRVSSPFGNYFEDELSPEAASIVVNLFVYAYLSETQDSDFFLDFYDKLMAYAAQLPEWPKIRSAID
jgi:hypothetical protein